LIFGNDLDLKKTTSLISADFCAIAVLISLGSVIGKASLSQLIIMATFEVVLQSLNEFIGIKFLQVRVFSILSLIELNNKKLCLKEL